MKCKIFVFIFLFPLKSFGYNLNNILEMYQPIQTGTSTELVSYVKKNYRIPLSEHKLSKDHLENIKFWSDVYSLYDSSKIVIHSKADLGHIFKVVNLNRLYKKETNKIVAEIKKNKILRNEINKIKKEIKSCFKTKKYCKLQINKNISLKSYLKTLRTQTGQLDILQGGLIRFSNYEETIKNIIKITNSNEEWLAIPFLESSFNNKAISKVGATGAWQIMGHVGKKLMPINRYVDTRRNPVIAAYAALKILRENRIITKNSDIAVISYNSGLRNYFNLKNKIGARKLSTSQYLSLSKKHNKLFSFASENFLLEYFAMIKFLKNNNILPFKNIKRRISSTSKIYEPYISRCKTRPSKVISLLSNHGENAKIFNNHFRLKSTEKVLPSGQIYLSNVKLPKRYYKKVKISNLDSMTPKKWRASYNNCSII